VLPQFAGAAVSYLRQLGNSMKMIDYIPTYCFFWQWVMEKRMIIAREQNPMKKTNDII
jgi:hypothetical protein